MKKIVLALALCLSVGNLFAQDADKLRDEGDAALKAKDYAGAVAKYGEYLKATDYKDTVRIFNCGFAANQVKNYPEAAKYFDMAIKMNYNIDDSYVGKAMALRNQNKTEEFLTTVEEGIKVIPADNKNRANLEKLLYVYCIKQGQAAQKKGDLAEAEKLYKEVLDLSNKTYQGNALYSLGSMFYGDGAKILQAATPIATSEPDKYNAEKAKADEKFKKSKDYLTKAIEINPNDDKSKKILDSINDILK
ncbi:tetratricopeptide repeat protein [Parabacteroides bouchesdurhonensis]|uniref:tetratricopeptide repeat protein n=1 Tax=Parabacteroides bouchesdurhonensis TaxID=1936995 RepID=UPI000C8280B9|nr:tetratricopeptide repeat protein [Parabacteroides bouchesdurhonensis]RHJ95339.1 tetratricopeptide repeat protein [Bacteroides sp. AM07-16]